MPVEVLVEVVVAASDLPWLVLGVLVGAAAFSCLGMMLASLTPSTEAAPPLANVVVLPLYFISGVFVPVASLPDWLGSIAGWLPVAPLVATLTWPYAPDGSAPWRDLALVVAWGLVGLVIAARLFRWMPRRG